MKNNILNNYAHNVYSQFGEDGIIQHIFNLLPEENDRWCVEFGAWDGKLYSNCCNLLTNHNWKGIMIEANQKKFADLKKNYEGHSNVKLVNCFVNFENTTIDSILSDIPIPLSFDLISIDIDGNDYHIWDSIQKYSPKVVVIEFNPTIPSDLEFIQEKNMKVNHGSSIRALTMLGKSKGYELIGTTFCNCFFVKEEYFSLFNIENNDPSIVWDTETEAPRVFHLYDGTIVLSKEFKLNWTDGSIVKPFDLQKLPMPLRSFGDNPC